MYMYIHVHMYNVYMYIVHVHIYVLHGSLGSRPSPLRRFTCERLIVRGRDTLKTGKAWDDTSREDRRKVT